MRAGHIAILLTGLMLVAAPNAIGQADDLDRSGLVGAWKLVELDQPAADGPVHAVPASGMFVFSRDGHLEVQVMEPDARQEQPGGPQRYSSGGYEASFGSYTVDLKAHTFTFHVDGALVPALIGKDLPRAYEIDGNRLTVKSTRADEHWRVVWERY